VASEQICDMLCCWWIVDLDHSTSY
jgi:hypothetical protein